MQILQENSVVAKSLSFTYTARALHIDYRMKKKRPIRVLYMYIPHCIEVRLPLLAKGLQHL